MGLGNRQVESFLDRELASSARGSKVVHGPMAMRVARAGQGKTQSAKHGAGYYLKLGEGKSCEGNEYYAAWDAVGMGNVSCVKGSPSVEHEGFRDRHHDSWESLSLEVLIGPAKGVMEPNPVALS